MLFGANLCAIPLSCAVFLLSSTPMKRLVIAEKPSVGRELARTLGASMRHEGYIEGDEYVVTWALGHLVELCEPAHYSERYRRWSMKDLPMIPETLEEHVIDDTRAQFDIIASLLSRSDVSSPAGSSSWQATRGRPRGCGSAARRRRPSGTGLPTCVRHRSTTTCTTPPNAVRPPTGTSE